MPVDDGVVDEGTDFCNEPTNGETCSGGFVVLNPSNGGGIRLPIGVEREWEALQPPKEGLGGNTGAPAPLESAKAGITGIYVQ